MAESLIPFDNRDGWIWFDGEFVEWRDARIHVLTHGLHYASCVYEGIRSYNGKIFKLREHIDRLYKSASALDMSLPFSLEELESVSKSLLMHNNVESGYLRPIVWRGSEQISTSARHSKIHVAIACWSWPSYYNESERAKGICLKTAAWRRPPPSCIPCQAKASAHYMISTLSKHAAEVDSFDDALMLDWRGQIAEATSANIFFIIDGVIHTPIPDCFLDGITRQTVIELAREKGMKVIERAIKYEEIQLFDECFLTGTAAEVCIIHQIDDFVFGTSEIGVQLKHDYSRLVRCE